jgi:hypothetical protein
MTEGVAVMCVDGVALQVHLARIPVALLGHGLGIPVSPGAELGLAPPLRHGVGQAQSLPVGSIGTGSHRQWGQVPDVGRQSQISVADDDLVDVYRDIIRTAIDGQGRIGWDRNLNDGVEKGAGEGARGVNVHPDWRLVVDQDADCAH